MLPWEVAPQRVSIRQGEWRWPHSGQPLNGGLSVALHDWSKGWDETEISARLNVITAGHNGKGNAVLTLGPGKVGLTDSDLRFQLTGQANLADFLRHRVDSGVIGGSILNPTLVLQPGALLRLWGKVTPEMTLEEARLPLAGVKVTAAGITGRLQAILNASDSYWGRFRLHLDGQAQDFWPDKATGSGVTGATAGCRRCRPPGTSPAAGAGRIASWCSTSSPPVSISEVWFGDGRRAAPEPQPAAALAA